MILRLWLSLFLTLASICSVQAETLRFATWNIENFWHIEGESLRGPYRGWDRVRSALDYAALKRQIIAIDADVWALQEMGSPKAARQLFPDADWRLVFSSRHARDLAADPDHDAAPETRDIYTALAIARDFASRIAAEQIPLGVEGTNREGVAAQLTLGDREVWVASVHLKSGCRWEDPATSRREDCAILAAQLQILEAWIDTRLATGVLVGGDLNRTLMGDKGRIDLPDPLWADLADGAPAPLLSYPFAATVTCPEGRHGARTWPVDFVLVNADWAARAQPGPYVQSQGGQALSDHCPVVVEFIF